MSPSSAVRRGSSCRQPFLLPGRPAPSARWRRSSAGGLFPVAMEPAPTVAAAPPCGTGGSAHCSPAEAFMGFVLG